MLFGKKSLAIDISDYSVEIISLGGSVNQPKLLAMGSAVIKPWIFEAGQIAKKEEFKKLLKELVRKPQFGRVNSDRVTLAVPEAESFVFFRNLPLEQNVKVEEFARLELAKNVPYPIEELYFDYQVFGKEVFIVGSPKAIINNYLEAIRSIGFKPVAVEVESISLGRVLINDNQPTMIADIGARVSNFSIFDDQKLKYSFSLPIAGSNFTKALAQKLDMTEERAEALKVKVGLDPKPEKGRVFLVMQKEMNEITNEVKRIEAFFNEKENKTIAKVILAGGSAALPKIAEYFSGNLEKPVEICDPWDKINIDILKNKESLAKVRSVNPTVYATAIGLALRGLENNPEKSAINLLPASGK